MSKLIDKEVEKSFKIINDGGIILYPTETIWGIGCDATKTVSVEKLFNIKNRSMDKPMLSLVSDIDMVEKYTEKQNDKINAPAFISSPIKPERRWYFNGDSIPIIFFCVKNWIKRSIENTIKIIVQIFITKVNANSLFEKKSNS